MLVVNLTSTLWTATLSLLVTLAFFPTVSAAANDYPYCDVVVRNVDGSISLHPECLGPPPGGQAAQTSAASSGPPAGAPGQGAGGAGDGGGAAKTSAAISDYPYCDVVVRNVDGSISLHPECLGPPTT